MAMRNRNERGRFKAAAPLDVRSEKDIPALSNMLKNGCTTFVLIWADWCGHCHRYKPFWKNLAKVPGRKANLASVHYDMQEKIPELADAKIQGYPSVVKVTPNGEIEEFPEKAGAAAHAAAKTTNAIPYMREEAKMEEELRTAPIAAPVAAPVAAAAPVIPVAPVAAAVPAPGLAKPAAAAPKNSGRPGPQMGFTSDEALKSTEEEMLGMQGVQSGGGSPLIAAFAAAIQKAAPAVALLAAHVALQKRQRRRTFKVPKRANRRASTRRRRGGL